MEHITEIPAHIRALPEAEQGPALVKAIHDRKADVSRETGMDLDLDSQAGYFEQLRQMMIFGEAWVDAEANTIRYRPDEHPWAALQPAGRRGGKSWAVQWMDEMTHWAATHDRLAIVRDVSARGLNPPKAEHSPVAVVHWGCLKPTDMGQPYTSQLQDWIMQALEPPGQDSLMDRYRFPYL